MNSIAFRAMTFAKDCHKEQKRKYTGNPYFDHLAEVAGITATVLNTVYSFEYEDYLSIAYLHDCIEDQNVTYEYLKIFFNETIANGVLLLSDLEEGNREKRKKLSRIRLSNAPAMIQNIKVADMISNTSSIVEHDPSFAKIYLEEKNLLLDVLTKADKDMINFARNQTKGIKNETN
jgi:guanosine-3',5'-bis(diphosphate) 3'-pyrophosphohydrolase